MRIYVGTYAKYNSGSLAGGWLDLEDFTDKEDFLRTCSELHKDESDPEFMFQDIEGIPDALAGESFIKGELWEILEQPDVAAALAFVEWYGEWDKDNFDDCYQGEFDNELDFTYQLVDDLGYLNEIPEHLQNYFDYERFSRDLFMTDYHFEDGFVFRRI